MPAPRRFDQVILATHSDQSLALLQTPSREEQETLGAIRYQPQPRRAAYRHVGAAATRQGLGRLELRTRAPALMPKRRGCACTI